MAASFSNSSNFLGSMTLLHIALKIKHKDEIRNPIRTIEQQISKHIKEKRKQKENSLKELYSTSAINLKKPFQRKNPLHKTNMLIALPNIMPKYPSVEIFKFNFIDDRD